MFIGAQEVITPLGAVLGLTNGMVGSLILFLPVLALQSGYAASAIVITITGITFIISSWLYLEHLGEEPDIGLAMKRHLKGRNFAKNIYQSLTWLYVVIICAQYFQLAVIQWEILIPELKSSTTFHAISVVVNGLTLFGLVLLVKYWEVGTIAMTYGVVSLILYLIYLLILSITENKKTIEPIPFVPFASGAQQLGGIMSQGFVIQMFLFPILDKIGNRNMARTRFFNYTILSYVFGWFIYLYIAEVGAFGIMYRQPSSNLSTSAYGILSYLEDSWMLYAVCATYLLHIYTVFPEYVLISKKKFFENMDKHGFNESSRRQINVRQIIYIASIVTFSILFSLLQLPITNIMTINGGILSCLVVYIIPACLHIYCMFFIPQHLREPFTAQPEQTEKKRSQAPERSNRSSEIQINNFQSFSSSPSKALEKSASEQLTQSLIATKKQSGRSIYWMEFALVQCDCDHYKRSNTFKVTMVVFLILMIAFGISIMVFSIKALAE